MSLREELKRLLGKTWASDTIHAELLEKKIKETYTIETLMLTLNTQEMVPAYFAYPNNKKKHPLVLYNHSHGGNYEVGKEEILQGSSYLQTPSFLDVFIKNGYAVGCIDMWGFGERQGKKESELFKEFLLLGHTLWGERISDNQQFLTYLVDRPEIDANKIATLGMSMGGMMSWWLAALDERISLVVDIAGQAEYESLIETARLDCHGFYYYIPGLLANYKTIDIQSLITPRPRLSLVGKNDRMCPLSGVKKLDTYLTKSYTEKGAPQNWQCQLLTGVHQETKEMRTIWQRFMKEHL